MRNVIIGVVVLLVLATAGVFYKAKSLRQDNRPTVASKTEAHPESDLSIEGRVVNSRGEFVAGAKVFVEMDDAAVGGIATDVSDTEGNFKIKISDLGNYTVYGSKVEDGYPLTVSGFHQQVSIDQIPKLRITERKTVKNVVLQLGERAAKIEGAVKDSVTARAIKRATITLRRAENPDLLYRISVEDSEPGKFNVLVPNLPFTMEVRSAGYEVWMYGDNGLKGSPPRSITLKRGESRRVEVALRKGVDR